MKNRIQNPFVFTKKVSYMHRISSLVARSHTHYVEGKISIKKAGFFAAKMDFLHACFVGNLAASRMRKKGKRTARLLFYFDGVSPDLYWILLVTPGELFTPDAGNEEWQDVTKKRIHLTGYELVRHIRKGNTKPSWTWRYTANQYDHIRRSIVTAIRTKHTDELRRLVDSTWRSPAFAGVREQILKIKDLIKAEWTRSNTGQPPPLPKGLGYVRGVPDKGKLLTRIQKDIENANLQ